MTDEQVVATRLLAVVRKVYDEGRNIIGERWSLFNKMKEMADRNDALTMIHYFEECLQSGRGKRVAEKLHAAGKKTLESEKGDIWAIVGEALVEAKIDCVRGVRDGLRRKRLEEAFETYWKRDSLAGVIDEAERRRLQQKRGVLPGSRIRPRLNALPFVFIRHSGPSFDRVRNLVEQAGEAYLLGLFEASAALGRAAVEVALVERWAARRREPVSGEGSRERWKQLVEVGLQGAAVAETQRNRVMTVKKAGDAAAHGEEVDGSRALSALAALRKFIGEFQW